MVGSGLVASMARPGGNTTGISILASELDVKRLQLLHEIVPQSSRFGVLADPTTVAAGPQLASAAAALGIELVTRRGSDAASVAHGVEELVDLKVAGGGRAPRRIRSVIWIMSRIATERRGPYPARPPVSAASGHWKIAVNVRASPILDDQRAAIIERLNRARLPAGLASIATAVQSMPPLDHADASIASGPPFLAVTEPPLPLFASAA